jgi:hypothetical protein
MYKARSRERSRLLKTLAMTRRVLLYAGLGIMEGAEAFVENASFQSAFLASGEAHEAYLSDASRQKEMWRAIKDLERSKYLEIRKKGGQMIAVLTEKGRLASLREQIRLAPRRTDTKRCVITFDIPTEARTARDCLRGFLKDCGFEQIHKSVWCATLDAARPLRDTIDAMGVGRWVRVYAAEEVDGA